MGKENFSVRIGNEIIKKSDLRCSCKPTRDGGVICLQCLLWSIIESLGQKLSDKTTEFDLLKKALDVKFENVCKEVYRSPAFQDFIAKEIQKKLPEALVKANSVEVLWTFQRDEQGRIMTAKEYFNLLPHLKKGGDEAAKA